MVMITAWDAKVRLLHFNSVFFCFFYEIEIKFGYWIGGAGSYDKDDFQG